jgi:hypothetical protein
MPTSAKDNLMHRALDASQKGRHVEAARLYLEAEAPYEAAVEYQRANSLQGCLQALLKVPRMSPNYRAACVHAVRVTDTLNEPVALLLTFAQPFLDSVPRSGAEAETMKELAAELVKKKHGREAGGVYRRVLSAYPNDEEARDALQALSPEERTATTNESLPRPRRFTEVLLASGRLNPAHLSQIVTMQKDIANNDLQLGEALVAEGSVSELDVVRALAEQTGIPFISGTRLFSTAMKEAAALLPVDKAEKWQVLPVAIIDRHLYVAMRDPRDFATVDQLRFATGIKLIKGVFATESTIRKGIRKMYFGEVPSDPSAEDWRSWDQMPQLAVSRFSDRFTGTREHEFDTQEMMARMATLPEKGAPMMATPPPPTPIPRPSAPKQAPTIDLPGLPPTVGATIANRYRLEGVLGEGGSAIVYRAHDVELDEPIALKLFGHTAQAEAQVTRVKMELSMSRQLTHPNIIRLFDLGAHGPWRYLTLELLEGTDLATHVEGLGGGMPISDGITVMVQACEGLQAAHDNGIVHRDVKPQNLFMMKSGVVKVMDFGIAKRERQQHITAEGTIAGTPEYMSPEQINGFSSVTHLTDVYALGCTAYTVFTGRPPFQSAEVMAVLMAQVNEAAPNPRERNPLIPPELEALMLKLVEKDPTRRLQSARAMADELKAIKAKL